MPFKDFLFSEKQELITEYESSLIEAYGNSLLCLNNFQPDEVESCCDNYFLLGGESKSIHNIKSFTVPGK